MPVELTWDEPDDDGIRLPLWRLAFTCPPPRLTRPPPRLHPPPTPPERAPYLVAGAADPYARVVNKTMLELEPLDATFGAIVRGLQLGRSTTPPGGAPRGLARARPADLPGPVPHPGRAGRPSPCASASSSSPPRPSRTSARDGTVHSEPGRRRREVAARQRGLAPRQHLHAGAGQGRGVHAPRSCRRGRGHRLGRHARRLRRARRRDPRPRRRASRPTTRSTTARAAPGTCRQAERRGRLRPVRLPRRRAVAAAAREGPPRHRPAEPVHRPPRLRHRRHGPRRVGAAPRPT